MIIPHLCDQLNIKNLYSKLKKKDFCSENVSIIISTYVFISLMSLFAVWPFITDNVLHSGCAMYDKHQSIIQATDNDY